jgi:hypothetical protein
VGKLNVQSKCYPDYHCQGCLIIPIIINKAAEYEKKKEQGLSDKIQEEEKN